MRHGTRQHYPRPPGKEIRKPALNEAMGGSAKLVHVRSGLKDLACQPERRVLRRHQQPPIRQPDLRIERAVSGLLAQANCDLAAFEQFGFKAVARITSPTGHSGGAATAGVVAIPGFQDVGFADPAATVAACGMSWSRCSSSFGSRLEPAVRSERSRREAYAKSHSKSHAKSLGDLENAHRGSVESGGDLVDTELCPAELDQFPVLFH